MRDEEDEALDSSELSSETVGPTTAPTQYTSGDIRATVNYEGKAFEFSQQSLAHVKAHHPDAYDEVTDTRNIDDAFSDPLWVETNPPTAGFPHHHKYYHERTERTPGPALRIYVADPTREPGRIITGWHQDGIDGTGTPIHSRHTRRKRGEKK